jgi:competence protein ComEC
MSRLLPAHAAFGAGAAGLALANATRVDVRAAVVAIGAVVALGGLARAPRLVIVALVAGVAGLAWGSVRLAALDRSPLRADVGRAGRFRVVVTGEPVRGRFQQRIPARAQRFEGRRVDERVQLDLPLGRAPPQGAIASLLAVVELPRPAANGFDEAAWLRRQGVHVVLHVDAWHAVGRRGGLGGLSDRLRSWLERSSAPGLAGERRAVLEGIVLGDDAGLSDNLKTSFRRSGLYHLLAVSGENVVLLAGGVLGLAVLLGISRAVAHLGALAAIGAYTLAVGPQPSVIRAAVAGAAVSAAWLAGRERDPWHVLLLAAVVLLAWNPYAIWDPGFQLSFAAVVAIFVGLQPLLTVLEGYPVPRKLAPVLAVSAVCSIATAPILWLQFGNVPLLGIVANAFAEPAVAPLLGGALVTAVVDTVSPTVAAALAQLTGIVAAYVALCARAIGALPAAQVGGRAAALAAAGGLCLAAYAWRRWRTSWARHT